LSLQIQYIATASLVPNPLNPRGAITVEEVAELAESLKAQGLIQPIVATPDGIVIAGHRRLVAALSIGMAEVPVIIQDLTVHEQVIVMLTENIQRAALTPLQEAYAYKGLVDAGMKVSDIGRKVGVQPDRVRLRMKMLMVAPKAQALLNNGDIPLGLLKYLVTIQDPEQQERLVMLAQRRQLNEREFADLVKRAMTPLADAVEQSNQHHSGPAADHARNRREVHRSAALEKLRAAAPRTFDTTHLSVAVEENCRECGMVNVPGVCDECPVPKLLMRIVK